MLRKRPTTKLGKEITTVPIKKTAVVRTTVVSEQPKFYPAPSIVRDQSAGEYSEAQFTTDFEDFLSEDSPIKISFREGVVNKNNERYTKDFGEYEALAKLTTNLLTERTFVDSKQLADVLKTIDSKEPLIKRTGSSVVSTVLKSDVVNSGEYSKISSQLHDLINYKNVGELIYELTKNRKTIARDIINIFSRIKRSMDGVEKILRAHAIKELKFQNIIPTEELIDNYGLLPVSGPLAEKLQSILGYVESDLSRWQSKVQLYRDEIGGAEIDSLFASRLFIPTSDTINAMNKALNDFREWMTFLEPFMPFLFAGSGIVGSPEQRMQALNIAAKGRISEVFKDITQNNALQVTNEFPEELLKALQNANSSYLELGELNDSQEDAFFLDIPLKAFAGSELAVITAFRRGLTANAYLDAQKATNRFINQNDFRGAEALKPLYEPLPRNAVTEQHYRKFDALISDVNKVMNRIKTASTIKAQKAQFSSYFDIASSVLDVSSEKGAIDQPTTVDLLRSPLGELARIYNELAKKSDILLKTNPLNIVPNFDTRLRDLIDERRQLGGRL